MSESVNPVLSAAVAEVMEELHNAGRPIDLVSVGEGLAARGCAHMTMGDLRAVLREKIAQLQGASDE